MKRAIIISLALVFAAIAWVAMYVPVAGAEEYTTIRPGGRGGSWEFILPLIYTDSTTVNGQGGSNVRINADWNTGFGFGYNLNDNIQINGLFTWSYRSYDATRVDATTGNTSRYSNYMDTSTIGVNGVYYLLGGNFTPFISAGIGYTYIDTNIQNGLASSNCWWDPWYGYVCSSYVPTKTESDWSYNAGIGIRYDVNRSFAFQGSYNKMWIEADKVKPDFDMFKIDFIFRM
jgi:opacity protein-like surface antigen